MISQLVELPKLTVAQVLIGLPLVHVAVVSLFVACYTLGFGNDIGMFSSIDMLFSTSIGDLFLIYLSGFVIPAIMTLSRYSRGRPNYEVVIEQIDDPEIRIKRLQQHKQTLKVLEIVLWAIVILITSYGIFDRFYLGNVTSLLAIGFAWLPLVAIYLIKFLNKAANDYFTHEALFLACMLVYSTIIIGIDRGNIDRHRTYEASQSRFVNCRNVLVIRSFGELYLAIEPSNRKVFVDLNCGVKFAVPG